MAGNSWGDFITAIRRERGRQMLKWGEQHHLDGTTTKLSSLADLAKHVTQSLANRGELTWAVILEEEFREAMAEEEPEKLKAELVQIATVCAAWVEDIESRTRG